MKPADWLITTPMLSLLILGCSLIVHGSFTKYFGDSIVPVIVYFFFMAFVVVFGFLASRRNWEKDKEPTLKRIREIKREFGDS